MFVQVIRRGWLYSTESTVVNSKLELLFKPYKPGHEHQPDTYHNHGQRVGYHIRVSHQADARPEGDLVLLLLPINEITQADRAENQTDNEIGSA